MFATVAFITELTISQSCLIINMIFFNKKNIHGWNMSKYLNGWKLSQWNNGNNTCFVIL